MSVGLDFNLLGLGCPIRFGDWIVVTRLWQMCAVKALTLSLAGVAVSAHAAADTARSRAAAAAAELAARTAVTRDAFAQDKNLWDGQTKHRSLQWNDKARWGLKLDLNQPVGRDVQLKDIQAGAFYRLTPSLQVGGAVSLGDSARLTRNSAPEDQAPRVRLETAFKF